MSYSPVQPGAVPIRPGKIWYWIVVLIMLALIGTGVALFVNGLLGALSEIPDLGTTYASGQTATVTLDAGATQAVYFPGTSRASVVPNTRCTAAGPAGTSVPLTRPSVTFNFTKDGGSWNWGLALHADNAGQYRVSCDGGPFALAPSPNVSAFTTRLVTGIVALIGGLLLGILGGVVGLIVVARRRSAGRRRSAMSWR